MRFVAMKRAAAFVAILLMTAGASAAAPLRPQTSADAARAATRERLRQVLDKVGADINVSFRQSEKQPFNFVGTMTSGLANAESFEIVVGLTAQETIGFRIYPHYKGGYINVDKVKNGPGLMRLMLQLSDRAFLFWGLDPSADVFAGYTFTLESGFPGEALAVVLRSIRNLDKFIGEMRPFVDGSSAPANRAGS
ncbi:MAG: hypothetical protein ACRD68_15685 [Pyrinomonadaceae bacterium]